MKIVRILASALALGVAAPAHAVAMPSSTAPLVIKSCVVKADTKTPGVAGTVVYTDGVTVVVENMSSKQITAETLSGEYNKGHVMDSMKVAIAPGATATLAKRHSPPFIYTGPKATCRVDSVTYADGTTWTAPSGKM